MFRALKYITVSASVATAEHGMRVLHQSRRLHASVSQDPAWGRFVECQASTLSVDSWKVEKAAHYLEEGCSVPFISRYRRVDTGDLAAETIFALTRSLDAFTDVIKTRENRLKKLQEKGVLDDILRAKFESCVDSHALDELWEPYKEKRSGKAQKAREIPGLEALAVRLLKGEVSSLSDAHRWVRVPADSDVTLEEGVQALLYETIAHDPVHSSSGSRTYKALLRAVAVHASIPASVTEEARGRSKFLDYDQFQRPIHEVSLHQVLALRRGKETEQLAVKLAPTPSSIGSAVRDMLRHYGIKSDCSMDGAAKSDPLTREAIVSSCVQKAVNKSIAVTVARDAWRERVASAEEESVRVFARNLRHLLLTPPLSSCRPDVKVVVGLDPGVAHGHKLAVLGVGGSSVLARDRLFSFDARRRSESVLRLIDVCKAHGVNVVAIGDGVGSREAQELVAEALVELPDVRFSVVSEVGASVYSVSPVAKAEFPSEDISFLGSVSIARRLIDPLSELVKVPPNALGIGMYQHDIAEKVLQRRLGETVEQCVNEVGADLNTASEHVLKYVSGLNESRARALVSFRVDNGPFESRKALKNVKGFGAISFLNAAGFLRVQGGQEPLDNTCVHPEQYPLARRLWERVRGTKRLTHGDLEDRDTLTKTFADCDWSALARALGESEEDLRCVALLLGAEGDVRARGEAPRLLSAAGSAQSVSVGVDVQGVVKNLAAFGAFVDLGSGHTGLLHRSSPGALLWLSNATVGQRVTVQVLSIDAQRGRIALSLSLASGNPLPLPTPAPTPAPTPLPPSLAPPVEAAAPREIAVESEGKVAVKRKRAQAVLATAGSEQVTDKPKASSSSRSRRVGEATGADAAAVEGLDTLTTAVKKRTRRT